MTVSVKNTILASFDFICRSAFVICLLVTFIIGACSMNDVTTDPSCRLAFSVDTVQFDTVFTATGSATKRLMVYNPNKQAVRTDIALAGGAGSPFRINIDGIAAASAKGIEIAAKDSMYIFVEATVDPQNSDLPVVVADSVLFETNTNRQRVCLEAYGQDVFVLRNETIGSAVWSGPKPYLVYGRLTVDTLETLRIEPGVHVYLHKDADIYVKGSVIAQGEADNPVVFAGDRPEKMYRDIPGQWGSIVFGTASRDNLLRHVEIRNGTNGLMFGNPRYDRVPALTLDAVAVTGMSYSGLMVFASDIEAVNCLIADCGTYTVGLFCGGAARFVHCTVAGNYSPYIRRKAVSALTVSETYPFAGKEIEGKIPGNVFFGNSIVYGTMSEEISIGESVTFSFDHCLLRTSKNTGTSEFTAVLTDADPAFADPAKGNFRLKKDSPARDAGNASLDAAITEDLDGDNRIVGSAPDLGAYEQKQE